MRFSLRTVKLTSGVDLLRILGAQTPQYGSPTPSDGPLWIDAPGVNGEAFKKLSVENMLNRFCQNHALVLIGSQYRLI